MRRRKNRFSAVVSICLVAVILAVSSGGVYLFIQKRAVEQAFAQAEKKAGDELSGVKTELDQKLNELESLDSENENLKTKIAELNEQIAVLSLDSDEQYKLLNEKIDALNGEILQREELIAQLRSDIDRLSGVYLVDVNKQLEIIDRLNELLEAPPMVKRTVKTVLDNGEELEEVVEQPARISLYYEDIDHGYRFGYNSDEVYNSASLIKVPFVLSILNAAVKEDNEIKQAILFNESVTDESERIEVPERTFDFSKTIVYTKDMEQEGSGKIKTEPEGTEYSYLQLIEYLLSYSDNVAYAVLKKEYGTKLFSELSYELGTKSLQKNLSNITAADGAKIMRAVYEFIAEDNIYSSLMYESLRVANHRVMVIRGVSPKLAIHKYGWDIESYHDMGIVYDKNPYVVVFLSDMDAGGDEINEYIQGLISLIDDLHDNFYSIKK